MRPRRGDRRRLGQPGGAGRGGPGRLGAGRAEARPAGGGGLSPAAVAALSDRRNPGARTMSWRGAALLGTRLVRSGSSSAGRLGGAAGAAASGYGVRRAGHGGWGSAWRGGLAGVWTERWARAPLSPAPGGPWVQSAEGPRRAAGAQEGWGAVNDALRGCAFSRIL